jgi:hypothetical protein
LEVLLAQFKRPENLIPVAQVACFMEDAAGVRGLDNLGARDGLATPVDALGTFGRLIASANTLKYGA